MNILPFIIVLFFIGVYCLVNAKNLIKILIGIELLAKATTLAIVWSGVVTNSSVLSQGLTVIVIIIEVMVVAIFLSLMYVFYQQNDTLDISNLERLKG